MWKRSAAPQKAVTALVLALDLCVWFSFISIAIAKAIASLWARWERALGPGGVQDTPCFRASPPVAGAALIAACCAATPEPSLPLRLPWQPAGDQATVRVQASPPGLQSYSSFTVTTNLPIHLFFHFTVSETNNGLSFTLPPTALPLLSASIP